MVGVATAVDGEAEGVGDLEALAEVKRPRSGARSALLWSMLCSGWRLAAAPVRPANPFPGEVVSPGVWTQLSEAQPVERWRRGLRSEPTRAAHKGVTGGKRQRTPF